MPWNAELLHSGASRGYKLAEPNLIAGLQMHGATCSIEAIGNAAELDFDSMLPVKVLTGNEDTRLRVLSSEKPF
jgi:hypothetical protein